MKKLILTAALVMLPFQAMAYEVSYDNIHCAVAKTSDAEALNLRKGLRDKTAEQLQIGTNMLKKLYTCGVTESGFESMTPHAQGDTGVLYVLGILAKYDDPYGAQTN